MADANRNSNYGSSEKIEGKIDFKTVVVSAAIFLILALIVAYVLLHGKVNKMIPHQNPTPNASVQQLSGPMQTT